jgi:hypothetical protein
MFINTDALSSALFNLCSERDAMSFVLNPKVENGERGVLNKK